MTQTAPVDRRRQPASGNADIQIEPYARINFEDRRKRGRISAFIVASAIFVAVNLGLSFYTPLDFDPFRFPYQGWSWWTFHDLRAKPELHNVALLGSSLMVSAVSSCDANHLQQKLDLTAYHKASYLDNRLRTIFGGDFNTYNLSAPGQMPSDAYLTLKAMLTTAHRPDVVIYGVAPRDFIDSRMASPTDTEPFRFLNRLVNTDECASGLFRDPLGRLDWLINRNFYFSHYAVDFQMLSVDAISHALDQIAPIQVNTRAYSYWERNKLIPLYKPGEIHTDAIISQPTSKEEAIAAWSDNTADYIERYRHPDKHTFRTQFYFLRKLVQLCRQERMELILVNMPIAKENIAVLKPQAYLNFVLTLKQFAFDQQVVAYDLNDFIHYNRSDYKDYVHLNAFGAKKFFDNLIDSLYQTPRSNIALRMAGQELSRQNTQKNSVVPSTNAIQTDVLQKKLENTFGAQTLKDKVDPALRFEPATTLGARESGVGI